MNTPSDIQRLQVEFSSHIPLTQAIGVKVSEAGPAMVRLQAPLGPNINDKGTAFGGSIAAVMTLAGWGLVWLHLRRQDMAADLVIHKQESEFLKPLHDDLDIRARLADPNALEEVDRRYQRGRRARVELLIDAVDGNGEPVARMTARYVVLPKL